MLFVSSTIMAFAWLGHLKFKELPFIWATLCCWLLVLPEYFINISAIRLGHQIYTGAQMAAFRLSSGVICVALVSRFLLEEDLSVRKLFGFGLMIIAMVLISKKSLSPSTQKPAITHKQQETL
ncbi:MAG: DMT family protein [Symploca sp. SIO2D2]|nr:DMT family protein [Symploca sp. SIO2D2]